MKLKVLIAALLMMAGSVPAFAQCSGNPAAGLVCGNPNATTQLPGFSTQSSLLDRAFGGPSLQGQMLNRGASLWSATSTPTLGLNGGTGGSLTFNGATSGSVTIGARAAAGSATFNLPTTNGTNGYALTTDGSGNTAWTLVAGTGTVQSVAMTVPTGFAVSGSPITGSGTLAVTLSNESANTVLAGPTTGAAATPGFRLLVGADLPNPGASSLGGVKSYAAVGSQWLTQISTSGVVSSSQPAFTDISGSVAAAQLPNPSASTLGGIRSYAAVTSQWINQISTSGVPSSTQPAFSDISGSLAAGQLPSISNNSILSNISGGTTVPIGNTMTALLDIIGSTRGQVLYRGASGWAALAPGTNGYVFTTGGAGADPSWVNPSSGGTVTQTLGTAGQITITGGGPPCTTSCTVALAAIANHSLLANISGGSAAAVANTMTAILDDTLGSTAGNVIYRGASNWTVLAPGTNGQVLTQGASTPSWANAGSVSNVTLTPGNGINGTGTCTITTSGTCTVTASAVTPPMGRLTLQTGTPVMSTSQSNKATLYYDCYGGNFVPFYNGSIDKLDTVSSCEVSTAMVSAASAGQVVSGQVYDVWWEGNTNHNICIAMSASTGGGGGWASDTAGSNTARGTGYSQLDRITRPYTTNKNAITNCFNGSTNYGSISANRATYLGTIYATANGQTSFTFGASSSGGTAGLFGVWNMYNRVIVGTQVRDTQAGYAYSSATVRQAGASAGNQVLFVSGLTEDAFTANLISEMQTTTVAGAYGVVGIGLDTTVALTSARSIGYTNATTANVVTGNTTYSAGVVGLHTITSNQAGDGSHNTIFDNTSTDSLIFDFKM